MRLRLSLLSLMLAALLLTGCSTPTPGPVDFTVVPVADAPAAVREMLENRHIDEDDDSGWIAHKGDAYAYIATGEQVRTEVLAVRLTESLLFALTYRQVPVTNPSEATPMIMVRFPNPENRLVSFIRE